MKKTIQAALLLFAGSAALIGCGNGKDKKTPQKKTAFPTRYWQHEICGNMHPDLTETLRDSLYTMMENATMIVFRQHGSSYKGKPYRDSLTDGYILGMDQDTLAYVRHYVSHNEYNSYIADTMGYTDHDYVCNNIVIHGGDISVTSDYNRYRNKKTGKDSTSTVYSYFRYAQPVDSAQVDTACIGPSASAPKPAL